MSHVQTMPETWITSAEVVGLLGCQFHKVAIVAKANGIRCRKIAGVRPLYSRDDCLRVVEASTSGGKPTRGGAA